MLNHTDNQIQIKMFIGTIIWNMSQHYTQIQEHKNTEKEEQIKL